MPTIQELFSPLMNALLDAYEQQRALHTSAFGMEDASKRIEQANANGKQLERWRSDLQLIAQEMQESGLIASHPKGKQERARAKTQRTPRMRMEEYTGKKPVAVRLFGEEIAVSTWRQVLFSVLEELYARHPEAVLRFEHSTDLNKKRLNFSKDEKKIKANPVYSEKCGLYVETNLGAQSIVRMCEKMLDACGYSNQVLHVITDEERN